MTKLGDELIKAAEEALEYHKKPECQHCNHYDELKADLARSDKDHIKCEMDHECLRCEALHELGEE